jgi:DNA helicase II / ATP-dependent DNA helicase PcrA
VHLRLPKLRDLTEEQKRVYLYAPTDRHVLVQGPPGTGKTLIACLRAKELGKKDQPFVLGMFNRVLAKYSSNVSEDGAMPSQTVLAWFRQWWQQAGLPPHPGISAPIVIQVPYEDREQVKRAGALWARDAWRPWGKGKGVWQVPPAEYFAAEPAFAAWPVWHQPPAVDGNPNEIDWNEVANHILVHEAAIPDEALNLGTLLIDEGQDFPPAFYRTLHVISAIAGSRKGKVKHPPRCFVLADENQQLTEQNSTLDEIASALKIAEGDRYTLLDNFRNSKEIAELARSFFSDVGVLPKLPKRTSEKPAFSVLHSRSAVVERIRTWVRNNPGKETGVLVFDDSTREALANDLEAALGSMRGRSITVQTYSWKSRQQNPADSLLFDQPDVVTVLNMQSCKGLEFDAVMIVGLHQAQIGLYGTDRFRMQMFVGVSRGRELVELIDFGRDGRDDRYMSCLPGPEVLERGGVDAAPSGAQSGRGTTVQNPGRTSAKNGHDHRVKADSVEEGDSWRVALARLSGSESLLVEDKSANGGAIWVSGSRALASKLEPLGFKFSEKKIAWWRKP